MENSNTIQTELQSLSPLIAALDKGKLYALPEGYFDELPVNLLRLARVSDLNQGFANPLSNESVPNDYFDQLAGNILAKIKAHSSSSDSIIETPEITGDLVALKRKITYTVPASYFEGLTNTIASKIEGVFDNIIEETNAISILVGSLNKKILFAVPEGYFETVAQNVQAKASPAAKVVSISKFGSFFKYAAAAIMIGAISFAVIKFSSPKKGAYIAKLDSSIQKGIKMDDKKFNETLNNLSEDDILQYLEKNSTDEDVATLTSDLEEKSLPAEDDYLIDDNTLDKFIETINTKN